MRSSAWWRYPGACVLSEESCDTFETCIQSKTDGVSVFYSRGVQSSAAESC
jgi:hypothetical protein